MATVETMGLVRYTRITQERLTRGDHGSRHKGILDAMNKFDVCGHQLHGPGVHGKVRRQAAAPEHKPLRMSPPQAEPTARGGHPL